MSPTIDRAEIDRAGSTPEAGQQKYLLGAMYTTTGTEQVLVKQEEDRELYHVHLQTFRDDYQPQGATEEHLVQSLADVSWRLNRVVALETNILTLNYAWRDLAPGLLNQAKALANLSLHSHRLSRQFKETVAQLRDLQKTRRAQDQEDLEIPESKGKTCVPAADGFVFSKEQIARAQRPRRGKFAMVGRRFRLPMREPRQSWRGFNNRTAMRQHAGRRL